MNFIPAKNKLEAVNRISEMTESGPEYLGPGSKERKSVLINLAIGLGVSFSHELTKQEIGSRIASHLGRSWLPEHESVGQTITLKGLNLLLEAAQQHRDNAASSAPLTLEAAFESELLAISRVVKSATPSAMDGKQCVEEMRIAGNSNWRQPQWQGFYFEMKAIPALTLQIGGGQQRFLNTTFDYVRNFVWDLKTHSSVGESGQPTPTCQLNDARAMEQAIDETGLGFIILSGLPTYDREFTRWHKKMRGGGNNEPGRTLKSKFVPQNLDIFFVPNLGSLQKAKQNKELQLTKQGKNSNGKPRPMKYSLDLKKAIGSDLQVYSHSFLNGSV